MSEILSVGKTREHNSEQIVIVVHMYILYYISTAQSVISYIALRNYAEK